MILKSNVDYVFRCMNINIFPGLNELSNEKIINHPIVKSRIDNNLFEIVSDKDFKSMSAKQLCSEINKVYNLKMLQDILESDNRQSVINAVKKQINKIQKVDERYEE